jgi:hypothetical protein
MAKKFYVDIDLLNNELQNMRVQGLASDPGSPSSGSFWYNTTTKALKYYDGTGIQTVSTGGSVAEAVTRATAAGAQNELLVSAGADRTAKTYSGGAGLVKADANGVVSAATVGTDYATSDSTNTFTNKSIDAIGTGNSITNLGVSNFASENITTDINASATSTQLARADAIKTYVDNKVASLGQFAGSHDASGGALPTTGTGTGGAIVAGDYWRVSTGGTISGLGKMEVGDVIVASTNGASIAANFFVLQGDITDAVTSSSTSSVDNQVARFDLTTGRVIQTSSATIDDNGSVNIPTGQAYKINNVDILTGLIGKYRGAFNATTDWTGASAPFTRTIGSATHGRGASDQLITNVYDSSGNLVSVDINVGSTGDVLISTNIKFAGHIVIIG